MEKENGNFVSHRCSKCGSEVWVGVDGYQVGEQYFCSLHKATKREYANDTHNKPSQVYIKMTGKCGGTIFNRHSWHYLKKDLRQCTKCGGLETKLPSAPFVLGQSITWMPTTQDEIERKKLLHKCAEEHDRHELEMLRERFGK